MYRSQCPVNVFITAAMLSAMFIFQSLPTGQVVHIPYGSVTPDFRTKCCPAVWHSQMIPLYQKSTCLLTVAVNV